MAFGAGSRISRFSQVVTGRETAKSAPPRSGLGQLSTCDSHLRLSSRRSGVFYGELGWTYEFPATAGGIEHPPRSGLGRSCFACQFRRSAPPRSTRDCVRPAPPDRCRVSVPRPLRPSRYSNRQAPDSAVSRDSVVRTAGGRRIPPKIWREIGH